MAILTLWQAIVGPTTHPFEPDFVNNAVGVGMVGFATVGALVASRQPCNSVGWLLLASAVAVAVQSGGDIYARTTNPGHQAVALFSYGLGSVCGVLILAALPLVFPDGRLLSRRWRLALWLAAAAFLAIVGGATFGRLPAYVPVRPREPLVPHGVGADVVAALPVVGTVLLIPTVFLTAASVFVRFRRSRGVERQQVKWFAFTAMLVLLGALALIGSMSPGRWSDAVYALGWTLFLLASVAGIPVATGIAIFRYRLYDIDRVINRTLVYGALTGTLLATYAVLSVVLGRVLAPLSGGSELAVAGSTLAVAALFRPARRRIQNAVDLRFYRRKYDAARTLDDFTTRLRHELDLDAVGADLCTAAEQTVQPTHVSLWLRP